MYAGTLLFFYVFWSVESILGVFSMMSVFILVSNDPKPTYLHCAQTVISYQCRCISFFFFQLKAVLFLNLNKDNRDGSYALQTWFTCQNSPT